MKTKHILTAMVLPTVLAACTADEIVENNNNVAVDRAEVPAVSFTVEGLESRLAFNEETFGWDWEDTDKFVIFPADNGAAPKKNTFPGDRFSVGSTLISGYEYKLAEDGSGYVTDAAMIGEGLYWGYAPSMEKTGRGLISYELATSQDAEYYKSEAAKAFVTPLYEISALNYNKNLPLQMVNWYSTIVLPLKNSTGEDITLNQIVLEVVEGNPFQTKGLIDINAIGKYVMAYDGEKWDAYHNYDKDKKNDKDLDGEVNEFIDEFRKLNMTTTNDDYNMTSSALLLNLEGEVLEAGETKEFYILAPASDGEISCNIRILAEEGYYEITSQNTSNYLKDTEIFHGARKAAFGWQTVKGETTAKAFNIKQLKEGENMEYHYVASYDDMMDLINTVNGDIKVYNVGDWKIDAKMADAITDSDCYVEFQNGVVYVGSNKKSSTATEEIEFTKVGFAKQAIVEKNTKVTFTQRTNKYNNKVNGTLVVKDGAEVIAEYGDFYYAEFEVEEGGKLTIKEGAKASANFTDGNANKWVEGATIFNEGETTLVAQSNVTVEQNGGTLYLNNKANAGHAFEYKTSYIKFNANKSFETIVSSTSHLVVDAATTVGSWWNSELEAQQYATLTVNHDLKLNNNLTIDGKMTVEGKTTGSAKLTNNGVFENNGDARNADIVNNGTFYNNDEADSVTNNGEIVTGRGSHTTVVKTDVEADEMPGRVDNTNEAQVNVTPERHIVYYTLEDRDIDDIEDIDFKKYNVNTLNVKGTLTLDRPFVAGTENDKTGAITTALSSLENLQLNKGAVLDIDKKIIANFRNVFVAGDAEIKGWSAKESTLTMYGDVNVYLMNKCVVNAANYDEEYDGYTLEINDVTINSTGLIKFNTLKEPCAQASNKTYRHVAAKIETDHASLENWVIGALTSEGNAASEGLYIDGVKQVKENNADIVAGIDLRRAVEKGVDVTLQKDMFLTEALIVTSDVTIDLNSYDLKSGKSYSSEKKGLIRVDNGSNVVITGGVVDASSYKGDISAITIPNGRLTIEDGEFYVSDDESARNDLIMANDGCEVIINGGTFKYTGTNFDGHSYLLNTPNRNGEPVYTVNGGSFYQFIPGTTNPDGWDIEHQLGKGKKVYKNNEKTPTTDTKAEEGAWYHVK